MIFPIPYTKGSKLTAIIGYSLTYATTDIAADISASRAEVLDVNAGDNIDLLWYRTFGILANGYPYVIFPNVAPAFPRFYYRRAKDTTDYTLITPDAPIGGGDTYWAVNTSFTYGDGTYTLYKRRGFGTKENSTYLTDQTFSISNPTIGEGA